MAMATSSVEANKAAIRRLYDETNKGNYDFLDELLAPDFTSYGGAGFKDLHGPAEFKELTMTFLTSFPDLWFQVDEIIGEGDDVLVSGTLSGTHKGDFYGMAATGNKVSWTGCADLPVPRSAGHRTLAGVRCARADGPDPAARARRHAAPGRPGRRSRRRPYPVAARPPSRRTRPSSIASSRSSGTRASWTSPTSSSRPTTRARARPACHPDRPARR